MNSKDVEEIFKGVLTDESQEGQQGFTGKNILEISHIGRLCINGTWFLSSMNDNKLPNVICKSQICTCVAEIRITHSFPTLFQDFL